jgi:predicted transcriptional regulator
MNSVITVRLERELEDQLDQLAERTSRSRSDIVRDALRRHLSLLAFDRLRQQVMPFAEARGYLTDEDIQEDLR